jgi:hypothetical protein
MVQWMLPKLVFFGIAIRASFPPGVVKYLAAFGAAVIGVYQKSPHGIRSEINSHYVIVHVCFFWVKKKSLKNVLWIVKIDAIIQKKTK